MSQSRRRGNAVQRAERAERAERRKLLPDLARDWVTAACRDPRYTIIKQARNALTHARMRRHLREPRERVQLELSTKRIGVRQLIEDARDYGADHVTVFLQVVPQL